MASGHPQIKDLNLFEGIVWRMWGYDGYKRPRSALSRPYGYAYTFRDSGPNIAYYWRRRLSRDYGRKQVQILKFVDVH